MSTRVIVPDDQIWRRSEISLDESSHGEATDDFRKPSARCADPAFPSEARVASASAYIALFDCPALRVIDRVHNVMLSDVSAADVAQNPVEAFAHDRIH
jgi:hypothetical protein